MNGLGHDIRWWREKVGRQAGIFGEDLDELEDHLRILIEKRIAEGASPPTAFADSARQLSDLESAAENWVPAPSVFQRSWLAVEEQTVNLRDASFRLAR